MKQRKFSIIFLKLYGIEQRKFYTISPKLYEIEQKKFYIISPKLYEIEQRNSYIISPRLYEIEQKKSYIIFLKLCEIKQWFNSTEMCSFNLRLFFLLTRDRSKLEKKYFRYLRGKRLSGNNGDPFKSSP